MQVFILLMNHYNRMLRY